jgi:hypothetical protein
LKEAEFLDEVLATPLETVPEKRSIDI